MFYFSLGWNEFATPIAVVRDIAVILTFAKLVLNISFGWKFDALICLLSGLVFILVGFILKATGMSDYATRVSNSVNPQLMLIEKIYEMVRK
jgi:hypothetical protein